MADSSWFEGDNSPGAGDLGQMQALQSNLSGVAEAARTARTDLNGLKNEVTDAVWRGPSAQEFKDKVDSDFLGQLDQLHVSYQDAADGFASYITAVSDIKERAGALASRIYGAQSRYESAAGALQAWANSNPSMAGGRSGSVTAPAYGEGSVFTVGFVTSPVPSSGDATADAHAAAAAASAQQAHSSLQAEVNDAWGAMQSLYGQMHELKTNDRAKADNAVVGSLKTAHDKGIHNESWWHHFWHAVSEVATVVAVAVLVVAAVAVVISFPAILAGGLPELIAALSVDGAAVAIGGTSVSLGTLVTAGGAIASGLALAGNIGEGGPVWKDVVDALGVVPGIGLAGKAVSDLGAPEAAAVSNVSRTVVDGKLAAGTRLETLGTRIIPNSVVESLADKNIRAGLAALRAQQLIDRAGSGAGMFVLGYGYPDLESHYDQGLFGFVQYQTVKDGWELIHGEGGDMASDPSASFHPDVQVQQQIAQLQQQDPAAAQRAAGIANRLASGKFDGGATPLFRYPQAVGG